MDSNQNTGLIVVLVLVVILAIGGVYYFTHRTTPSVNEMLPSNAPRPTSPIPGNKPG